ncbi:MAG: Xaa-Pro dipeptidase [Planctomycetales bacterium]|nr:Xaa-Pro dipeptidase [Planctomycetales bacterium]
MRRSARHEMVNYQKHIDTLVHRLSATLEGLPFDGIAFHSGQLHYYFADDIYAPFHSNPHFAHWVPLAGPGHLVVARPEQKPKLIALIPEDYWYEPVTFESPFWIDSFDFVQVSSQEEFQAELGSVNGLAFIGESCEVARELQFSDNAVTDELLTARLNWDRTIKTDYEVDCIDEAAKLAAKAHRAAREAFESGGSEIEIHHAYVIAIGCIDAELPYESIIALNEKGSYLHYVNKRTERDGKVLLIDSGAAVNGYASDITRTWTSKSAAPVFQEMRDAFDNLERNLCEQVQRGLNFIELHETAHREIGKFLSTFGVLKVSGDEAFDRGLTHPFFPHGLGHDLGIQVHDIAGRQANRDGGTIDPPEHYPFLRNTRVLQPGNVVTIEPGCYFIEMLLRPFRSNSDSSAFNWELIDQLSSHGGIRTEDDILVTANGNRNLTRPYLPE